MYKVNSSFGAKNKRHLKRLELEGEIMYETYALSGNFESGLDTALLQSKIFFLMRGATSQTLEKLKIAAQLEKLRNLRS